MVGGENLLLESILDMESIFFLPILNVITTKKLYNRYLNSIDSVTLLYLIENHPSKEIEFIQSIFKEDNIMKESIENLQTNELEQLGSNITKEYELLKPNISDIQGSRYYKEFINLKKSIDSVNNEIQSIKLKINSENIKLQNFKCLTDLKKHEKHLMDHVLNCSEISNKNVNWYNSILGVDKLDEHFEYEVYTLISKIGLNYDTVQGIMEQVIDDKDLKDILKNRILGCSKDPETIIKKIVNTITFQSKDNCNPCHNKCILYLNKEYKKYLLSQNKLSLVNKLKILIVCEIRLLLLLKLINIELTRLELKDYKHITNILDNLINRKNKSNEKYDSIDKYHKHLEELTNIQMINVDKYNKLINNMNLFDRNKLIEEPHTDVGINKDSKGGQLNSNIEHSSTLKEVQQQGTQLPQEPQLPQDPQISQEPQLPQEPQISQEPQLPQESQSLQGPRYEEMQSNDIYEDTLYDDINNESFIPNCYHLMNDISNNIITKENIQNIHPDCESSIKNALIY